MTKTHLPIRQIELRLTDLNELFNSIDPTPFHHRRLDRDIEDYLETWAMSFSSKAHFHIVIHLENMPDNDPIDLVTSAIQNDFKYKAERAERELSLMLRNGRISLIIGLLFLTLCLLGAQLISEESHTIGKVIRESLMIAGWVSLWQPMQIFLYGWWPIIRKRNIRNQLARAIIRVLGGKSKAHDTLNA